VFAQLLLQPVSRKHIISATALLAGSVDDFFAADSQLKRSPKI